MTNETMIKKYMEKWNCSRDEAIEMIAYDEETDKMTMGEINATMTKEEKEAVKQMTKTTSETKDRKKVVKERKKDEKKLEIVAKLADFAKNFGENVEILKPEREILFEIDGESYSIQLVKHRKEKK